MVKDDWPRWLTYVGCTALFLRLIAYNFVDIDLWHQMGLIRESQAAGHLLRIDPYAYTPTLAWIDHEWGAGVIAYFATMWMGAGAIVGLKFLTALGAGFLCVGCARARGAGFRVLMLCAPLAILLGYFGFYVAIRAQAYTFLLTALWLYFLNQDSRGSRKWILPALLIFPLWVNIHAGFVVAILITALHALEAALRRQPFRHLLLVLGAMILGIFLNPYGLAYFSYLARALLMRRPYAPEWAPIYTLGAPLTIAFAAAAVTTVYAASSIGWSRVRGVFILAATAGEAMLHRKHLPLFAIAWLCYVPVYLQATPAGKWWIEFSRRRSVLLSAAWVTMIAVCIVTSVGQKPWQLAVPEPPYPVGAVDYLARQKFVGNLMVPFRAGAYVSWKLFPAVKVSLDSRYEVAYPDQVVRQNFDFYAAQDGWQSTLAYYPVDAVLIPFDAAVLAKMRSTAWQRVYIDLQFQIYCRPGCSLPVEDRRSNRYSGTFP